MNIITEQSPHIRRKDSLNRMMSDVLIALAPVTVFALIVYKWFAVRNILVSVATMVLCEFLFLVIKNLIAKKNGKKLLEGYHLSTFLVPTVSGLIYGLITPATYWGTNADGSVSYASLNSAASGPWGDGYAYLVLIVGAMFGIIVGKFILSAFLGTGHNVLNPAATGFVFSKFVFGARYAVSDYATTAFDWTITGATTLHYNGGSGMFGAESYTGENLWQLIIGETGGLMGETCKIAILIGLVYLLIRHTVDWRTVASFFGTFIVGLLFVGILIHAYNPDINVFMFVLVQLFAGGVIFGGTFMLTDPVTGPLTKPAKVLFGMIVAICTLFFRYLVAGGEHYIYEGMAISILIGNAVVPLLDYNKWNSNEFNKLNVIILACFPVLMIGILMLCEAGVLGLYVGNHYVEGGGTGGSTDTGGSSAGIRMFLPFVIGKLA